MEQHDCEQHTPLSLALLEQRVRCSQVLLECGANPNQRNGPFGTCLHLAIFKRSIDMTQKLLNAGANPNQTD
jgi:ankyrin repeat protein